MPAIKTSSREDVLPTLQDSPTKLTVASVVQPQILPCLRHGESLSISVSEPQGMLALEHCCVLKTSSILKQWIMQSVYSSLDLGKSYPYRYRGCAHQLPCSSEALCITFTLPQKPCCLSLFRDVWNQHLHCPIPFPASITHAWKGGRIEVKVLWLVFLTEYLLLFFPLPGCPLEGHAEF